MTLKTPSEKMYGYHIQLWASGLLTVQVYISDTYAKNFAEEARRQSLLVSPTASEGNIVFN